MTDDQKAQAIALRSDGMSYLRISAKIGCSESVTFRYLSSASKPSPAAEPKLDPKPKPAIPQKPPAPIYSLLPEYKLNSSCPKRRPMNSEMMKKPQPTKAQLMFEFEKAWKNTAQLAHR
jgi:hypothetical protein